MRSLNALFAACLMAAALLAPPAWAEDCIRVSGHEWGKHCNADPVSLEVMLRNYCAKTVAVSACLGAADGKWKCALKEKVAEGEEFPLWACNATGNYKIKACDKPDDCDALKE